MVDILPKCPKCGEPPLDMTMGSGWKWSEKGEGKRCPYYKVDGKMQYTCGCGHKWEK